VIVVQQKVNLPAQIIRARYQKSLLHTIELHNQFPMPFGIAKRVLGRPSPLLDRRWGYASDSAQIETACLRRCWESDKNAAVLLMSFRIKNCVNLAWNQVSNSFIKIPKQPGLSCQVSRKRPDSSRPPRA
jgi:hypothetical protein